MWVFITGIKAGKDNEASFTNGFKISFTTVGNLIPTDCMGDTRIVLPLQECCGSGAIKFYFRKN